jgi:hypothetical protein
MLTRDIATQIYTILKQPQLNYLTQVCCFYFFFLLCFPFHLFLVALTLHSVMAWWNLSNILFIQFPFDSKWLTFLLSNLLIILALILYSHPSFYNWYQDDFKPILRELLATHPGLEFLQSTPEFQERYGLSSIFAIAVHLEVHRIVGIRKRTGGSHYTRFRKNTLGVITRHWMCPSNLRAVCDGWQWEDLLGF